MRDARATALVFVAAVLIFALGMSRGLNPYDEGLILVGAARVANGAIPHRDFYANYGPGQFYVLAALFKLFGPSVLIERLWDTAVRAAIATLAFHLAARRASRREGLIAGGLCVIWLLADQEYALAVFPALLFALIALWCLTPVIDGRSAYALVLGAGFNLGVATLFRYDVGAYGCFALGLFLVLRGVAQADRWSRVVGNLICLMLGLALVCVPLAALYLAFGVTKAFVADIIDYPAKYYWRMRSLPFPGPEALIADPLKLGVYLPPTLWLASVFAALASYRVIAKRPTPRAWLATALMLMSALFYTKGLVRVSTNHMISSIVPALIASMLLVPFSRAMMRDRNFDWRFAAAMGAAIVSIVIPTWFAAKDDLSSLWRGFVWAGSATTWAPASVGVPPELAPCHPQAGLGRMACFATQADRAAAVLYVDAHTRPGDSIFIGAERHDRLYANDNMFYFLAGRLPATRYSHFDPGLQTRQDIQTIMVDELRKTRPPIVVRNAAYADVTEPNGSSESSGVRLLDTYLDETYRPVRSFGPFTILAPRG